MPADAPGASAAGVARDVTFIAVQALAMKAARLQQDLERLHEVADRAAALDAVAKRLGALQSALVKLAPLTPDGQAKADEAKATLAAVAKRLASAAAGGEKAEKPAEDF